MTAMPVRARRNKSYVDTPTINKVYGKQTRRLCLVKPIPEDYCNFRPQKLLNFIDFDIFFSWSFARGEWKLKHVANVSYLRTSVDVSGRFSLDFSVWIWSYDKIVCIQDAISILIVWQQHTGIVSNELAIAVGQIISTYTISPRRRT